MLASVLAMLLGLGSLIFYMAAFLYPEVHRRSDFVWSGLGLLYAADLWFGAEQITPVVLLGQGVAVTLLAGLGWQTLTVRREKTPVYQQTPIVLTPEVVGDWAKSKLNQLRIAPTETVRPATLKDRPLTGASTERLRQGLNQRLDPRRRPLYDYEFVEDGVLEGATREVPEISSEDLEAAVSASEPIDPPFAIAKIIAIQPDESTQLESTQVEASDSKAAEIEPTETEPTETEPTETRSAEFTTSEPEVVEPEFLEAKTVVAIADESVGDASTVVEPAAKPAAEAVPNSIEVDEDWDDELDLFIPEATASQVSVSKTAQKPFQKPSMLAMPIIFLDWIKDVAQSLTKPKPSKPVINIPRREAPSSVKDEPSIEDIPHKDNPPFEDSPPPEDNREDSNWVD